MISFTQKLFYTGQLPKVRLEIKPLDGTRVISFDKFTSYNYSSNMLVPVDAFNFSFTAPNDSQPFTSYAKEGDIVTLWVDNEQVSTGIIDRVEVEIDDNGEHASITGRDMLGRLEDMDAVTLDKLPLWGKELSVEDAAKDLIKDTRIQKVVLKDAPTTKTMFATSPGESRLSSLLRHMEPLNVIAWSSPEGYLIVGKPNFYQRPSGTLILNKDKRESNILSCKVTYSSCAIPNKLVVLWSDVQDTLIGIPDNQIFENKATGPSRLLSKGHYITKTCITSHPSGGDPQSLAAGANYQVANAAGQTVIQALGKRELARANFHELLVQIVVPGHFNDQGEIYKPDTVYSLDIDRAGIQENIYLYSVDWNLTSERGQYSVLRFCKLHTIVSDTRII